MNSRGTLSGTDGLPEHLHHEAERQDNEEQEQLGFLLSNSSVGNREFQAADHLLSLQEPQAVFQSGANASLPSQYSQQAVGIQLPDLAPAATSEHMILPAPIMMESSQQGIQSLNPGQQPMSFSYYQNQPTPFPNGNVPSNQNMHLTLADDQQIVPPSLMAHQAGQSPPYQHRSNIPVMGMGNQGYTNFPADEAMQRFGNALGAFNVPYNLPVSNLPPEFRLETPSRIQQPQIQQQDPPQFTHATLPNRGNGGYGRQQRRPPPTQTTMHVSPTSATRPREIQFEGLLNQASSGPRNFHPGTGSSSRAQIQNMPSTQAPEILAPYIGSGSSLPFSAPEGLSAIVNNNMRGSQGDFVNFSQYEAGGSSQRPPKMQRRMPSEAEENVPPSTGLHLGMFPQGQNYPNHPTINTPQCPKPLPIMNKCYDPMYEEMGLPVDPHLRMFLMMTKHNNGGFGNRHQ